MARVFNGIGELVANAKFCGVYCRRLVKRSEALWGHNLTRDIQAPVRQWRVQAPEGFDVVATGTRGDDGVWRATGVRDIAVAVGRFRSESRSVSLPDGRTIIARVAVDAGVNERPSLYLDRIVNANLPDRPTQPRRWIAILTIFASAMLIYGVGWLVWAGVREHRQD